MDLRCTKGSCWSHDYDHVSRVIQLIKIQLLYSHHHFANVLNFDIEQQSMLDTIIDYLTQKKLLK